MKRWKDGVLSVVKLGMKPKAINMSAELTPKVSQLSAKFVLLKPNATTVTKTVWTDPDGKAGVQFSLGTKYPLGTYKGTVTITVAGKVVTDTQLVTI